MTSILIVDDAQDAAETLAMLFEACGHEAHVAFDGREGVAAARHYAPHIIFLDLDMPVLDGLDAARAIRAAPEADDPFIVALTAKSGGDVQAITTAAGFDFYLRKPADSGVLLALVAELQGRRHGGGDGHPGRPNTRKLRP